MGVNVGTAGTPKLLSGRVQAVRNIRLFGNGLWGKMEYVCNRLRQVRDGRKN